MDCSKSLIGDVEQSTLTAMLEWIVSRGDVVVSMRPDVDGPGFFSMRFRHFFFKTGSAEDSQSTFDSAELSGDSVSAETNPLFVNVLLMALYQFFFLYGLWCICCLSLSFSFPKGKVMGTHRTLRGRYAGIELAPNMTVFCCA